MCCGKCIKELSEDTESSSIAYPNVYPRNKTRIAIDCAIYLKAPMRQFIMAINRPNIVRAICIIYTPFPLPVVSPSFNTFWVDFLEDSPNPIP
uniref:Uncharacterized protein n=1 Tax=Talaromyces marneffei PM1 TaxID=1077442 RepID=A0A093VG99_TALMA